MKFCKIFLTAFAFSLFTHAASQDIEAGPLWDNEHAKRTCPLVCDEEDLSWNGNWHTTIWGEMSVCSCDDSWAQTWQQSADE